MGMGYCGGYLICGGCVEFVVGECGLLCFYGGVL